jgi:PPE family
MFELGLGPEATLAAAAAWAVEAATHDLSMGLSAVNIASLVPNFLGVGGTASAQSGSILNSLAGVMGGHCLKQQVIALAAAELYAATRAGLIPSAIIDANRVECAADITANPWVLGALTGRITELQGEYGAFWAQNAGLGTTYGTTLNTMTSALLATPPPPAVGSNPAGSALMAASVVQDTGTSTVTAGARAGTELASTSMQGVGSAGGMDQIVSGVTQALTSAVQPMMGMFQSIPQSMQGLASIPQSLMGLFGGMFGGMNAQNALGVAGVPGTGEALRAASLAGNAVSTGAGGAAGAGGGIPGSGLSGLTSYTRPVSSFEPEGGRATGLRSGLLNPADLRAPVASGAVGGSGMPVSPAGMLGRGQGEGEKRDVQHARVVLAGEEQKAQ